MSTAQQIVTRAYRRLQAIDINELPSDTELAHALDVMAELVNGWGAGGVITEPQTILGDIANGDDIVRNVADTGTLMIGHNVSGTGIPSDTFVEAVLTDISFRLSANATSNLAQASLAISFLPVPVKYEGALVALLAMRLKGDLGITLPPELAVQLANDASSGWDHILSGYIPERKTVFDRAIARPASPTLLDFNN